MKKLLTLAIIAGAGLSFGAAQAQTCVPNQPALNGSNSGTVVNFDCATGSNQLNVACFGLSPVGATNEVIWQLTIGPGAASGNIVVTPTGAWDPYLFVMSSSCSGSSGCPIDQDNNGAGQPETGSVGSLGAGTYWLAVTDESAVTSCGAGTVTLPTLPVALQNFTIE